MKNDLRTASEAEKELPLTTQLIPSGVPILRVVVLALLFMFFMMGFSFYQGKQTQKVLNNYFAMDRTSTLLTRVKKSALELRRIEKNFIQRNDSKYIDLYEAEASRAIGVVSDLILESPDEGYTVALQEIFKCLERLKNQFLHAAETLHSIGLSHQTGLQAKMRENAHKIEKLTQDNPVLLSQILMLRRYEKDFLMRKNEKYLERFNIILEKTKSYIKANSTPQSEQFVNHLDNYVIDFKEIAKATLKSQVDISQLRDIYQAFTIVLDQLSGVVDIDKDLQEASIITELELMKINLLLAWLMIITILSIFGYIQTRKI